DRNAAPFPLRGLAVCVREELDLTHARLRGHARAQRDAVGVRRVAADGIAAGPGHLRATRGYIGRGFRAPGNANTARCGQERGRLRIAVSELRDLYVRECLQP